MTATVLVWHNLKGRTAEGYWVLTTLGGQRLSSVYRRPSGRWYGDVKYWKGNAPVKNVADRQPTPENAKFEVERYLDARSRVYFGSEDITFLTWDDSADEAETLAAKFDWKRFEYAETERRAMAQQYQEAMKRDAAKLSMYDGSAMKAFEDWMK